MLQIALSSVLDALLVQSDGVRLIRYVHCDVGRWREYQEPSHEHV